MGALPETKWDPTRLTWIWAATRIYKKYLSMEPTHKIALAHDWLTGMRGGERVLELLCREYPDADLYTLLHNKGSVCSDIESRRIYTSFLQKLPGIEKVYRYALPVFPLAVRGLRAGDADLIISTSHCVAKGVRGRDGHTRHLCYCFTPMRYAWTFYEEYFGSNPIKMAVLKPVLAGLRKWDLLASEYVDRFVAISHHVRKRIETNYGRRADVIYPPVDTDRCVPSGEAPQDFDLIVSALVPYKKVDIAVKAYAESGRKLKVIGTGSEYGRLRALAAENVEFLGWQSDENVVRYYQACRCLVFPGEEDFGIVPVEAQACGRPVVALNRGGLLETVREGESGLFFDDQTADSLNRALERFEEISWDGASIREFALQFRTDRFLKEMRQCVAECLEGVGEKKGLETL